MRLEHGASGGPGVVVTGGDVSAWTGVEGWTGLFRLFVRRVKSVDIAMGLFAVR